MTSIKRFESEENSSEQQPTNGKASSDEAGLMGKVHSYCKDYSSVRPKLSSQPLADQFMIDEPTKLHPISISESDLPRLRYLVDEQGEVLELASIDSQADHQTTPSPPDLLNVSNLWRRLALDTTGCKPIFIPNTRFFIFISQNKRPAVVRSLDRPDYDLVSLELPKAAYDHTIRWFTADGSDIDRGLSKPQYMIVSNDKNISVVDLRKLYFPDPLGKLLPMITKPHPTESEENGYVLNIFAFSDTRYFLTEVRLQNDGIYANTYVCFEIDTSKWPSINEKDRKLENIIINKIDLSFDIEEGFLLGHWRFNGENHELIYRRDHIVGAISISADLQTVKKRTIIEYEEGSKMTKQPKFLGGRFIVTQRVRSSGFFFSVYLYMDGECRELHTQDLGDEADITIGYRPETSELIIVHKRKQLDTGLKSHCLMMIQLDRRTAVS